MELYDTTEEYVQVINEHVHKLEDEIEKQIGKKLQVRFLVKQGEYTTYMEFEPVDIPSDEFGILSKLITKTCLRSFEVDPDVYDYAENIYFDEFVIDCECINSEHHHIHLFDAKFDFTKNEWKFYHGND